MPVEFPIRYLDEWLTALGGPQTPPFKHGTLFKGEMTRFFRFLTTSVVLTAAVLGGQYWAAVLRKEYLVVAKGLSSSLRQNLLWIAALACIAAFYKLYAWLFRIKINVRQAFFAFSLTALPWMPIIAVVNWLGHLLPTPYVVLTYIVTLYVIWLIAKALSLITGKSQASTFMSLMVAAVLVILAAICFSSPPPTHA
jgi:hypothetical protein